MTPDITAQACPHPSFPVLVSIPMDIEMPGFTELERLRDRGGRTWWLWVGHCPICDQNWLVAQEERVNDVVVIRRLSDNETKSILDSDVWPDDFVCYEDLIRVTQKVQRFRFASPEQHIEDLVDLANERPGISVGDLADLLNLADSVAIELSQRAVKEFGANITIAR